MTYAGSITAGEVLILVSEDGQTIIECVGAEDKTMSVGYSSLYKVTDVRGLTGVAEATVNLNMWNLYRPGDPALTYNLLEYIREGRVL